MNDRLYASQARSDFGRLRTRETLTRILSLLKAQRDEMLSLGDVRSIVRPDSETYKGMRTVPVEQIVGSEGRFKDFNRAFLPRHDKMARRWIRVDMAHYQNVILPPIKLFEIGGVYFVRDGNHRVSVAKSQGAEFIDAEVTSLASKVELTPRMTREELKRVIIDFEKKSFFEETHLDVLRPGCVLECSEVGRYDELRAHIREHKWYINLKKAEEIPFEKAVTSWYDNVYFPIMQIVRDSRVLAHFPHATEADLYVYVGRHWSELIKRYGPLFTLEEAAEDFTILRRKNTILKVARRLRDRAAAFFRRR